MPVKGLWKILHHWLLLVVDAELSAFSWPDSPHLPCCCALRRLNHADIERIAPLEEEAMPYHQAEAQRQVA